MEYEKNIGDRIFLNGGFCDSDMFDIADENYVMKKMITPNNVKILKGYFPESAVGVNDKFVFVNLDMDLYKP